MKIYFITFLLFIALMLLIIFLDMIMGSNFIHALPNLRKPFEVTEPAESLLLLVLLGIFLIKPLISYFINKKKNSSSGN